MRTIVNSAPINRCSILYIQSMGKAYSLDLRKKVISFLLKYKNKREASKIFGIGEDTIYRWLRRYRSNDLAPKNRTDFLRKVSLDVLRIHVEKHQDHTLKEIGQALGFSASNVLYGLRKLNITRKKRPRSMQNVAERSAPSSKKL